VWHDFGSLVQGDAHRLGLSSAWGWAMSVVWGPTLGCCEIFGEAGMVGRGDLGDVQAVGWMVRGVMPMWDEASVGSSCVGEGEGLG
jgi:hypothetical protein